VFFRRVSRSDRGVVTFDEGHGRRRKKAPIGLKQVFEAVSRLMILMMKIYAPGVGQATVG
jgi:hypothetical protein